MDVPTESEIQSLASSFADAIQTGLLDNVDETRRRVADYFNLKGNYAAFSSDTVGLHPPTDISNDDVLAVSFLDTPIRASAYRRIQASKFEIGRLLGEIPPELPLWKLRNDQVYESARRLWNVLDRIPYLGSTRVSKLMARKRPRLIPIFDSRVKAFFGKPRWEWLPLGRALQDTRLRKGIKSLGPRGLREVTLLRILDVAIWMRSREGPP